VGVIRVLWCAAESCGQSFLLCQGCYHGEKYCSTPCRRRARRAQLDAAQQYYLHTLAGRQRRAAASAAYRSRRKASPHLDASKLRASRRTRPSCRPTRVASGRPAGVHEIASAPHNVIDQTLPPLAVSEYEDQAPGPGLECWCYPEGDTAERRSPRSSLIRR
jgi:hypothetical protein